RSREREKGGDTMQGLNVATRIIAATSLLFVAACGSGGGPTTQPAGVSVNTIRSRAQNRWNQFLSQHGVGTIIANSSARTSLGQQLSSTEFINFWKKGNNYRTERRDADGGEPTIEVLNGRTLRINVGSLNLTRELFIDRLKPINQRKFSY